MAESVVGGQEEPGVSASLGQRLAGAVGEHVGIVGVGDSVGRASLARQIGRCRARVEQDRVLLFHEIADGKRDTGGRGVGNHVDLLVIDPLAGYVDADIRLVLMVAADDIDRPAFLGQAGILDRHLGRNYRLGSADVGIETRHIVEDADLRDLVGSLR